MIDDDCAKLVSRIYNECLSVQTGAGGCWSWDGVKASELVTVFVAKQKRKAGIRSLLQAKENLRQGWPEEQVPFALGELFDRELREQWPQELSGSSSEEADLQRSPLSSKFEPGPNNDSGTCEKCHRKWHEHYSPPGAQISPTELYCSRYGAASPLGIPMEDEGVSPEDDWRTLVDYLRPLGVMAYVAVGLASFRLYSAAKQHQRNRSADRIVYRGSITDLATDVAYEIDAEQARELINELERFMRFEPNKFRDDYRARHLLPKNGKP